MAIVEKKFLLNTSINEILKDQKNSIKISQFYTKIQLCQEIRYQKVGNKYYKTVRTGSDVRKNIVNKEISKNLYKKAKEKKIGSLIVKKRYTTKINNQKLNIDRYEEKLKGIYILEKSFKNLQDEEKFKLPQTLKKYIEEDVSHNNRYRDKNLALLGNPKKISYELYKIYKDIQNKKDIDDIPFKEMSVADFVRIELYKKYIDIQKAKEDFLANRSITLLKKLQKLINDTKILLKEFQFLFKDEKFSVIYKHFCMVNKAISIDEEIDILKQNMQLLESVMQEKEILGFIKVTDKKVERKKDKIYKFLCSREFNIILNQFDLLLKEPESINKNSYTDINIFLFSKKIIKKAFKQFNHLTKKYDKCYDLKSYQKIDKSLYKLQLLIKIFFPFYKEKKVKKIQLALNQTKESLDKFIYLSRDVSILKEFIEDSSSTIQEQNKKIKTLIKAKKELEKVYNTKIEINIKKLKTHKKRLLP
jgi:CYTH domain-containing protein